MSEPTLTIIAVGMQPDMSPDTKMDNNLHI